MSEKKSIVDSILEKRRKLADGGAVSQNYDTGGAITPEEVSNQMGVSTNTAPGLQSGEVNPITAQEIQSQMGIIPQQPTESSEPAQQLSGNPDEPMNVVSPDGKLVAIAAKDYHDAITNGGYKPASDEMVQDHFDAQEFGGPAEQLKTGLEHAASTATFGLSTGVERAMGVPGHNIEARTAQNPKSRLAGDILGLIAPIGPEMSAGSLLAKASEGAATKLGLGALEHGPQLEGQAAKFISNPGFINGMKVSALRGSVETGLLSAGDEVSQAFSSDNPSEVMQHALPEIGLSTLLGGGLGAGIGSIHPLWKATSESKLGKALSMIKKDTDGVDSTELHPIVKKALSVLGGVPEKDIDAYTANRDLIRSAPEFEDIYDKTLDHVDQVHAAVAQGKAGVDEAHAAFKELKDSTFQELKEKGYSAKQADDMASMQLKTAQTELAQNIQQGAMEQSKPIVESLGTLRNHVVDQSAAAYDILDRSGAQIPLKEFYAKGAELATNLEKENTIESKNMANRIHEYMTGISDQSGRRSPTKAAIDVKPMIQGLDRISKYDFNASTFDKGMSSQYNQLRHTLDSTLKVYVPEYAAAMKPLARDTQLLSKLGNYGTEEQATRRLKSIKNPATYKNEMPLLRDLENRVGSKFTHEIEPYANPEMRANLMKGMPEYAQAERTASVLEDLKNPAMKAAIEERLMRSEEAQALNKSKQTLADALNGKEGLSKLTPTNLESRLKAAMRGRFNAIDSVSKLPDFEGKNINDVLSHIGTREAFNKSATNGSRNVNVFGGLGSVAGELLGHHLLGGLGIGAVLGAVVDKYGPNMTGHILDAYLDHWGKIPGLVKVPNMGALRFALAKVIDSKAPVSAAAFNNLVSYASAVQKGDQKLDKETKNLFAYHKPANPINSDTTKLKKTLLTTTPEKLAAGSLSGLGSYMPDHQSAASQTAATAAQYLASQKPDTSQQSPLDSKSPVSTMQQARYERTLGIAEHPTNIFSYIKSGTITPKDVVDFKSLYPDLYDSVAQKLNNQVIEQTHKGQVIPYQLRQSLSMFLGQPLDSTLTPASIMAAQGTHMAQKAQSQAPQQNAPKGQPKALKGMAEAAQTPGQNREADKQRH